MITSKRFDVFFKELNASVPIPDEIECPACGNSNKAGFTLEQVVVGREAAGAYVEFLFECKKCHFNRRSCWYRVDAATGKTRWVIYK